MTCRTCDDGLWVCENHADRPWEGTSNSERVCPCGGAGMPCPECNGGPEPRTKWIDVIATIDPTKCRHLSHSPKGICTCGEQHQPLTGYSDAELNRMEAEYWAEEPASADTHRDGEDATKIAAEFMGGAVPKADAQTPSPHSNGVAR